MNYVHPDIVVGEPIPEIEPRIDQFLLRHAEKMRWKARVLCGVLILIWLVFAVFDVGFAVRVGAMISLFVVAMAFAMSPQARAFVGHKRSLRGDNWPLPLKVQVETQVYGLFVMLWMQMVIRSNDGISGLISSVGIYALIIGIGLVWVGRVARQPGQICCVGCEYPLVGLTLPCACPECGRALVDGGSTTDRPRVRSRWFSWGGGMAAVLGGLIVYSSFARPGVFYGPMPRSVLLKLAASDRDAFDQLLLTPLDADEEQRLIDAMVNGRTTESYQTSFTQGQWLSGQILSGGLSEAQLQSVFERTGEVIIDAPAVGRVGEPIELRLKAEDARSPSFSTTPGYYFEGFGIGDDSELYAGSGVPRFRLYITKQEFRNKADVPRFVWMPTAAGEYTVRARVVLALFPGGGSAARVPIDWSQDGAAMFGVVPVWATVVNLEHTIVIES